MISRAIIPLLLLLSVSANAQTYLQGYNQSKINPSLLTGKWKANWISMAGEQPNTYGVYHMRKSFDLDTVPERFIVHVSADNRYKLYINGHLASLGPARGDIYNWNYETVDIAPWLHSGNNLLAAVVWNYAEFKPIAQMSFNQTGFLLQGDTAKESIVNTNTSWKCIKNESYSPWLRPVRGYYAAGPGESVDANLYPWGWELPEFDDSNWPAADKGLTAAAKGTRDYPGRLLVPRPIPQMELCTERFKRIRLANGIHASHRFLTGDSSIIIPPGKQITIILDNEALTTSYLTLKFSQGKGSKITIGYAEALYESENGNQKGNRNDINKKQFQGYEDKIEPDGGDNRTYTTLWWRTWRYAKLTISTDTEPLTLNDIYGIFTAYPFKPEISFEAKNMPELNDMLKIGWRTARLCANETYMDCPYYEQLQYFGDTRIQAMVTMYNTRDTAMVKNALEQGRQSMVPDGITMSRYPSSLHQFIPSFSIWWICMGHDYWMYRGGEEYLKTLLPSYRNILSWYENQLSSDGSLTRLPHWFFTDWADGFSYGEPPREADGNSAVQDLTFLIGLNAAAEMESAIGSKAIAHHYRSIAKRIQASFHNKYWDDKRHLYADTRNHSSYSQHTNALAVIAGITSGDAAKELMLRTLDNKSLTQATIYFRYYLHQALNKAGLGDLLLDNLQIWRDQMALGLTTWAEMPEPSRSDCHAWGSSPNIELFRILLGIDSSSPGFRNVRIAPSLGKLTEVKGCMPHPMGGSISVDYKIDSKNRLNATITLPENVTGTFDWHGHHIPLHSGRQQINVKKH